MLIFAGWPFPGCSGPAETSTESGWSQATLQKVVPPEESLSLIALVVCESPALPQKGWGSLSCPAPFLVSEGLSTHRLLSSQVRVGTASLGQGFGSIPFDPGILYFPQILYPGQMHQDSAGIAVIQWIMVVECTVAAVKSADFGALPENILLDGTGLPPVRSFGKKESWERMSTAQPLLGSNYLVTL